jgi:transposase
MAKALSFDLRSRVVASIESGLSCRAAAAKFGVSASSVIRWRSLHRQTGDARAKRQGGDRRSGRTHADLILGLLQAQSDITLEELRAGMAERGIGVGIGTLWRFFDRRRITLKKSRRTRLSRTVPTS